MVVVRCLAATLVALFATVMVAFSQGGVITGKVTDGETGDPLRGVTVTVIGTKKGAYSDTKGVYRIKGVPAGRHTIRMTYVGYSAKQVENIEVKDGQTVTINAVMTSATTSGKEVVVTAERLKDNQAAVLAQRQKSSTVSDGVAKEEISKLPDSDAGQSLKRVTGVTLVEGKYVFVRGVSDRYSNTTLNGTSLTTTEPDKKSFAFDMFPAELLENVNIAKSFTPDLPGNFVGGLVQLNTVDFPQGFSIKVSTGLSSNDYVTNHAGQFITSPGGGTDWLGLDDGTRAMPANMPGPEGFRDLRAQVNARDEAATNQWLGLMNDFNPSGFRRELATAPFAGKFSISHTNTFDVGEESQFGLVASVNYNNGYSINRMTRAGILSDGQSLIFDYTGTIAARNTNLGSLVNLAFKPGSQSTITLKNTFSLQSDDETVYQYGSEFAQSQSRKNLSFQFVEKQLFSSQLGGEHNIDVGSNLLIDWKLGYSESSRDEPDLRRLRFQRDLFADSGTPLETAVAYGSVTSQGSGPNAGRFFSTLNEFGRSAAVNGTLSLSELKIKAGALHEFRNRSFRARSFTYVQPIATELETDVLLVSDDPSVIPDPSALFDQANFGFSKLGLSEDSRLRDTYTAFEQLVAGYAMVDVPFTFSDIPVRIITGARVENNIQSLSSFNDQDRPVNVELPLTDILPSFNLVVTPWKNVNFRLAASQTLTRPSLREFAPFAFFDFQTQSTVRGNPDLTRALVQNYDARFEWFTNPGEVISVSLFYKNFLNAIEETIDPSTSELIRTFQNARGVASNQGVEFEVRKGLGDIADALQYFMATLNVSLINSNITVTQGGTVQDNRQMWGQSPYSINAGLFFQHPDWGTSVNLAYNVAGRRIVQVAQVGVYQVPAGREADGPHVFENPRDVVDLSIAQNIGMLELRFSARDLLNQALVWEQLGRVVATNIRGRSFGLSVGYRFN